MQINYGKSGGVAGFWPAGKQGPVVSGVEMWATMKNPTPPKRDGVSGNPPVSWGWESYQTIGSVSHFF